MRRKNIKNASEKVNMSKYILNNIEKIDFNKLFNNNNKTCVEIGMGKGKFIIEMALNNPNLNFIGLEKYSSVILQATKKLENMDYIPNLKLINADATNLLSMSNEKTIDLIYFNFSDPWPKKRHSERRLTSNTFLKKYDNIFKKNKEIVMKTDNIDLFAYSLETLSQNGYVLEKVSLDLHNSDIENNIMTEYEQKFVSKNVKINFLTAKKGV